jgi:imidazoleglycerol phosphate dehydratase HisB
MQISRLGLTLESVQGNVAEDTQIALTSAVLAVCITGDEKKMYIQQLMQMDGTCQECLMDCIKRAQPAAPTAALSPSTCASPAESTLSEATTCS